MSDSLGDGAGNPTGPPIRLYKRWAEGGVALSFIGEVQGDPRYAEKPGNLVLGAHSNNTLLRSFARRARIEGAHLWPQLGHAGALSHLPISKPTGPSPLDVEGLRCEGMSIDEIRDLPAIYGAAALHAKTVGFSGVQVHAGHGFLLSQFLSPLFNRRTDAYGGSIEARCRIVIAIIAEIRLAVGPRFPIGIRLNSSDQLEGGLTEADALEAVRVLDRTPIDLIDISGGTFFPGAKASSDGAGQGPYFLDFARRAREVTNVPLLVTGGIKRRKQAVDALASGAVDMLGLARAMVLDPALPDHWSRNRRGDAAFPKFASAPPGGVTAWYTMRLAALVENRKQAFDMDLPAAVRAWDERDARRCMQWRNAFSDCYAQRSN